MGWFRSSAQRYYNESATAAAQFIKAEFDDVFIVNNATMGTNFVIDSLDWQRGDSVLLTTHSYLAVCNTIETLMHKKGVICHKVPITFPITSKNQLISLYEDFFRNNPDSNVKLAIVDHISSCSAVLFPVKEIAAICKANGVLSLIDGAHAPGQISLDMSELDCDFYVGNFHKWSYASRHCGFLYVNSIHKEKIRPSIVSNYKGKGLKKEFAYMGTCDTTSLFTLKTALQFYENLGGIERITSYNADMISWAQTLISTALGTKPLEVEESCRAPNMGIIDIPEVKQDSLTDLMEGLTVIFWEKYKVQACFIDFDGKLKLRISCNVYNNQEDYLKAAECLKDFFQL